MIFVVNTYVCIYVFVCKIYYAFQFVEMKFTWFQTKIPLSKLMAIKTKTETWCV